MKAKRPTVITCTFPNICPISSLNEGISKGHYTGVDGIDISRRRVRLSPIDKRGGKKIHIICFPLSSSELWYIPQIESLIAANGKRFCKNAPHYLLGLMATLPEEKMPSVLAFKSILGAEPDNPASIWPNRYGLPSFLCIRRYGDRRAGLAVVGGMWTSGYAFLTEDA